MGDPTAHGVWVSPCLLTPRSRGSVRLASNDPTAKPIVRNDFYSAGEDLPRMLAAHRLMEEICAQPALRPYCAEPFTAPAGDSDEDLRAHVARTTFPIYHPVGTCAIGSVVDARPARPGPGGPARRRRLGDAGRPPRQHQRADDRDRRARRRPDQGRGAAADGAGGKRLLSVEL